MLKRLFPALLCIFCLSVFAGGTPPRLSQAFAGQGQIYLVLPAKNPLPGEAAFANGMYAGYAISENPAGQYEKQRKNGATLWARRSLTKEEGQKLIGSYRLSRREAFYEGRYDGAQVLLTPQENGFLLTIGQPYIITDA